MRWSAGLAASLVVMSMLVSALAAEPKGFASAGEIASWMSTYREKPEPKRLAAAVHALSDLGQLSDQEAAGIYVGFMAGVLGANQLRAPKLVAAMFPLRTDEQVAVIKAIAYSGLPNWRQLLVAFSDKLGDRQVLVDRYMTGKFQTLAELPVESGRTLDTLWGYYMATGSYEPIQRIIGALPLAGETDDLERLVVGGMVKWTLASNGERDQSLLKLYYVEKEHQPEAVAAQLGEIIEAIEVAETGQIRKTAAAAIDELKTKGPASKRTIAWAGQVGQTALALGCVAASVMGQVQLGVPCVVGGAVSSAALKLYDAAGQ